MGRAMLFGAAVRTSLRLLFCCILHPLGLPLFAAWLIGSVLTVPLEYAYVRLTGPWWSSYALRPFLTSGPSPLRSLPGGKPQQSPERRARWQQFRRPEDRARSICADHLARTLLREAGAQTPVIRVREERQALCARRPGLQLQPLRKLRVLRRARRPCRHRS